MTPHAPRWSPGSPGAYGAARPPGDLPSGAGDRHLPTAARSFAASPPMSPPTERASGVAQALVCAALPHHYPVTRSGQACDAAPRCPASPHERLLAAPAWLALTAHVLAPRTAPAAPFAGLKRIVPAALNRCTRHQLAACGTSSPSAGAGGGYRRAALTMFSWADHQKLAHARGARRCPPRAPCRRRSPLARRGAGSREGDVDAGSRASAAGDVGHHARASSRLVHDHASWRSPDRRISTPSMPFDHAECTAAPPPDGHAPSSPGGVARSRLVAAPPPRCWGGAPALRSPKSAGRMSSPARPAAFAQGEGVGHARVLGRRSPSTPATSALSVPWPDPVAAKEPYRVKTARSGCSPKSSRAMEARARAPAVCELDGVHHDGADNVPQTIGFHKSSFRVSHPQSSSGLHFIEEAYHSPSPNGRRGAILPQNRKLVRKGNLHVFQNPRPWAIATPTTTPSPQPWATRI